MIQHVSIYKLFFIWDFPVLSALLPMLQGIFLFRVGNKVSVHIGKRRKGGRHIQREIAMRYFPAGQKMNILIRPLQGRCDKDRYYAKNKSQQTKNNREHVFVPVVLRYDSADPIILNHYVFSK